MLDLADLRIFLAVVNEGGIVKASRKLHRVPSGITTRIQKLEAATGTELFHRHKQRLPIRPAGALPRGQAAPRPARSARPARAPAGTAPTGGGCLGPVPA